MTNTAVAVCLRVSYWNLREKLREFTKNLSQGRIKRKVDYTSHILTPPTKKFRF